ncbi:MAG TPA: SDR family oxidoreductase [Thermoanaerobaculia bacterium]
MTAAAGGSILIVGGNGTVGRHLVRELVRRRAPARALVRSRARATAIEGTGLPMVVGDLADPASLDAALAGIERVFLLSSPSQRTAELHGNLVDAARRAGVRHVVRVSALGAKAGSSSELLRGHGEAEAYLEGSGLAWTHLRPAWFMQNLLGYAPWIAAHGELAVPIGRGTLAMIDARDVARVAAVALTVPGHEGRTWRLTGPEALGFARVAEVMTEVLGRPVRHRDVPPEEARRQMIAGGTPEWLAEALLGLYRHAPSEPPAEVSGDVEAVTGRPATPLAEFVRDHAAELGGDESATGSE